MTRTDSTGRAVVTDKVVMTPLPHPDFRPGQRMILGNIHSGVVVTSILRNEDLPYWTHAAACPVFPKS